MYTPNPLNLGGVQFPRELLPLVDNMAENVHEEWAQEKISEGWTWGEEEDDKEKKHPSLVPYKELPESEKEDMRDSAITTILTILACGFKIVKD